MKKLNYALVLVISLSALLTGCNFSSKYTSQTSSSPESHSSFKKYPVTTETSATTAKLAQLNYSGKSEIVVNHNNTSFSKADLREDQDAWQMYGSLDRHNRVTAANALLNQSTMPKKSQKTLNINPTGWQNKRYKAGQLYSRTHLISYQLAGQNNNPRNLMTATRELKFPNMRKLEIKVSDYLKKSSHNYVRYRVTPIFRDNELLARGVQVEAQSIGSNAIHFNVYIFNAQKGVKINYMDGTAFPIRHP